MKRNIVTLLFLFLSTLAFSQANSRRAISWEEELNRKYCSGLFSTPTATYFDMENDISALGASTFINVLDWLQGRVAGLQVQTIRNTKVPFLRNMPAAIFIDEIRVDPGFLNMLPVTDIGMIKVMRSPHAPFWSAPGGAIAIYTKIGEDEEEN